MYADYLKERYTPEAFAPLSVEEVAEQYEQRMRDAGFSVFNSEEGFITFELRGDAVIVYDIYVKPEMRGKKVARKMHDALEQLGRQHDKRVMIGFSTYTGKNRHLGVTAMKAGGFHPSHALDDSQMFIKGI